MKRLSRVGLHSLLGPEFPVSSDKDVFYLLVQEGYLSYGRLISYSQGDIEEGQGILLAPAISQVTSIQNNQYVILAYLGVTYPEPHYLLESRTTELLDPSLIIGIWYIINSVKSHFSPYLPSD